MGVLGRPEKGNNNFYVKDLEKRRNVYIITTFLYETVATMLVTALGLASVATAPAGLATVHHAFSEGGAYFFGFLVAVLVSGAHLNSAITLGMWLLDLIANRRLMRFWIYLLYFLAQYVGAVLGVLLVWAINNGTRTFPGLGAPVLGTVPVIVTNGTGFAVEAILSGLLTFAFVFTYPMMLASADKSRFHMPYFIRALVLLFALIAFVFVGHTVSGAGLSPMRYLAVMTVAAGTGVPSNWWIWVFGPFAGGAVGALLALLMLWALVAGSDVIKEAPAAAPEPTLNLIPPAAYQGPTIVTATARRHH